MFEIVPEHPKNFDKREKLLDLVFGTDRHNLTTYKLRININAVPDLSYVALIDGEFQGSLRFWPIKINGTKRPLLLGPLAVDPARSGQAIGVALVRNGLVQAKKLGYDFVVLIGDFDYYKRFGFIRSESLHLSLPGPYDPKRLLIRKVPLGPIKEVFGPIKRADEDI